MTLQIPLQFESCRDPWVGLDIGGANLKAAHTSGWSASTPFAMWKEFRTLAESIAKLLHDCPAFVGVAITMTGELADCFATRAEGVAVILEQLTNIIPASMVRVYCVDGQWKSVSQSARDPWKVAASNWHALAKFSLRYTGERTCLLMDTGSTTTDLVPIRGGAIALDASTDSQRLQSGSLVYTGIERSNIVGLVSEVTLFGTSCPVMNEQFATTRDVYLWLRDLDEEPSCTQTADGKPATRDASRFRLARVVGEDGSTLADADIDRIAEQIAASQTKLVAKAINKVIASISKRKPNRGKKTQPEETTSTDVSPGFQCVVLSGHGDFLLEAALASCGWDGERILLRELLGVELSRCAPAFAVAVLASEERNNS